MGLKKLGLASAVMLATSSMAFAADDLQINGFINVTAGIVDNSDIKESAAANGFDTTAGFDALTSAGLQISKKVNDNTSATLQLMSRGSQNFKTEAAWAYITYELSDNTDIRFGRLRTPFFHYSDFLEVGYAYNWVTPPKIVYRLDTMSAITGADISHRFTAGALDGSIQVYAGRYNDDFNLYGDTYNMELRSAAGTALNLNWSDFGARLSYHRAEFYINGLDPQGDRDLDGLIGLAALYDVATGLATATSPDFITDTLEKGGALANSVRPQGQQSQFYQGSLYWDNGSTSLIGEYTALRHDSAILNDDDAWLVSAAQRMGDFTLHLTYAAADDSLKKGSLGIAQRLNTVDINTTTLGLRYDYNSSTAFKVEATYINRKTNLNGLAQAEVAAGKFTEALTYAGTLAELDGLGVDVSSSPAPDIAGAAQSFGASMITAAGAPLVRESGTLFNVGMTIVF